MRRRSEASLEALFVMNPPSPDRTPYLNRLHDLGLEFEVIYVPIGPDDHGWGEFDLRHPHRFASSPRQAAAWAARVILHGTTELVICYGYRTLPFAAALTAARVKGIPTVVRSDTNIDAIREEPMSRRYSRRAIARAIIPKRTVAWTIGGKNSAFWEGEVRLSQSVRIPYEVLKLPGGADPVPRTRDRQGPLRLLYVGRLIAIKGLDDLLAAVGGMPRDVSWELCIVGDGPDRPRLEAMANGDPRIRFVGAVPHSRLGEYFADAHVFVLPSRYEPWGLVVNEALGFGLYTVASDAVGAAHDLIVRGVNGEVVRARDVRALRSALVRGARVTELVPMSARTDTSRLMLESIRDITTQSSSQPRAPSTKRRRARSSECPDWRTSPGISRHGLPAADAR